MNHACIIELLFSRRTPAVDAKILLGKSNVKSAMIISQEDMELIVITVTSTKMMLDIVRPALCVDLPIGMPPVIITHTLSRKFYLPNIPALTAPILTK
jgi:hypothetical protein